MVFFTTPELLEIGGCWFRLCPLKNRRGSKRFAITAASSTPTSCRSTSASRSSTSSPAPTPGPPNEAGRAEVFDIETRSDTGVRRIRHTRNVIFAIGYFDHPNVIGVPGESCRTCRTTTRVARFLSKNVVIVGGGNSAAETALELYRVRGARHARASPPAIEAEPIKYWVRPDIENRIKEGSVRGLLNTTVVEILPSRSIVERDGAGESFRPTPCSC